MVVVSGIAGVFFIRLFSFRFIDFSMSYLTRKQRVCVPCQVSRERARPPRVTNAGLKPTYIIAREAEWVAQFREMAAVDCERWCII